MSVTQYLQIDYSKPGIEVTEQAKLVAKFYKAGEISQEQAKEILEPYFDWLYSKMKKINPKRAKKPTLSYFVRAMA